MPKNSFFSPKRFALLRAAHFKSFRKLITLLLCFQLAVGLYVPSLPVAAAAGTEETPPPNKLETELLRLISMIESSSLEAPPKPRNIALMARQEVWDYDVDGISVTQVYDLSKTDVSLPEKKFVDEDTQLEFEYDAGGNRLFMHLRNFKRGQAIRSRSHVWYDVTMTSDVLMNAEFVFLPTSEGIRVLPMSLLKQDGFNRFVPALLGLSGSSRISKISFASRESQPRSYSRMDGSAVPSHFLENDLFLEVESARSARNGQPLHTWVSLNEIIKNAAMEWLTVIQLMIARSPQHGNPKAMEEMQNFLNLFAADIREQRDTLIQQFSVPNNQNELLLEAAATLAERSGLTRHMGALGQLVNQVHSPRDRFPSDPNGAWQRDYDYILQKRDQLARENKKGAGHISWSDILADRWTQDVSGHYAGMLRSEQTRRGRLFNNVKELWDKTSSPKGLAALAGVLAGVYVSGTKGLPVADQIQVWMTSALSQIWVTLTTTPYLPGDIRNALTGLPDYVQSGGSISAFLAGVAAFVPTYFVSIGVVWAYQTAKAAVTEGRNFHFPTFMKAGTSLLSTMLKGYLWVNKVMQIFPWITRQQNIYFAVDDNLSFTSPGVLNSPFASKQKIADNRTKINEEIENRSLLNGIATRFAAVSIVAAKFNIDPATLIQEERLKNGLLFYIGSNADPAIRTEWIKLTGHIQKAATEVLKNPDVKLDLAELKSSYAFYTKIGEKLAADSMKNPAFAGELLQRLKLSAVSASRSFTIFMLGGAGRTLFNKLYHAQFSEEAAKISLRQGLMDFTASQAILGGDSPEAFAGLEGRIGAMTLEQLVIYTGQNPADVLPSLIESHRGVDNRIGARIFDPKRALGQPAVRALSLPEALAQSVNGLLDTREPKEKGFNGPLDTWAQYIRNLKDGAWVRVIISTIPLYLMPFWDPAHPVSAAGAALSTAIYILLSKMAYRTTSMENNFSPGTSQGIMGYAVVWAFVTAISYITKVFTKSNLKKVQNAGHDLIQSIENNDLPLLRTAVRQVKELYAKGGVELPVELNKDSDQYSVEDGKKLLNFAIKYVPVATTESATFDHILNFALGSFLSVVLYNGLQQPLVNSHGASLTELAYILGWLTTTYVAVTSAKHVIKPVIKGLNTTVVSPAKQFWSSRVRPVCELLLGRDPVNTK